MGFNEASTIQAALLEWAEDAGWEHIPGKDLPRAEHDVLIDPWVREALVHLNPELAAEPGNLDMVLHEVEQAILDANNGLVAANERLTVMLRGDHAFLTTTGQHVPRRFFDFDNPNDNRLTVADEVTIRAGGQKPRRFDVVYYINGIPLVVTECKTPVKHETSWYNAAKDIYGTYEAEYPQFFATNVFNVATEGLQFRMAPIQTEPDPESEFWAPWDELTEEVVTETERVERGARLLMRAETILDILRYFAMYRHARDASESDIKFLPRYPQYWAVLDIHRKVLAGRPGGLAWHHQGSGKTELMAFAATMLLRDPKVAEHLGTAPTIVVIADRTDLVNQTAEMFETAGLPRIEKPTSKEALRHVLRKNQPRIVITTVHKFAEAPPNLSDRPNIVVLVDEAHRSQEGSYGKAWRAAVPNAKFFGATGTPIEDGGKSTISLFGDPEDEGGVMSRYTPVQSILDGFTKPVIVEGRAVGFDLAKEALDLEFDDFAEREGLTEEQKAYLSDRASRIEAVLSSQKHIDEVTTDIVEHFLKYVAPLGQKAQVVAYNQELVVKNAERIEAELKRLGDVALMPDGRPREVAVVMSVVDSKDTPAHLRKHILTPEQVEHIKRRFKKVDDPLSFVVVTAKLMTGFNAPIEGVLYLDKPMKGANLFQTITRPNRPWKNPLTDQRKEYGRVVDYVGLAKAIGEALLGPVKMEDDDPDNVNVTDLPGLVAKFSMEMTHMLALFDGVDMNDDSQHGLAAALERIPTDSDARSDFIDRFVALEKIWEFAYPHPMLDAFKKQYLWLSRVFEAVRPRDVSLAFVWEKFGAKTTALVHEHMSNVHVRAVPKNVTLDGPGIQKVKEIAAALRIPPPPVDPKKAGDVLNEVLDSIEARLRRMNSDSTPEYQSLAKRIEDLRNTTIHNVEESLAFLEQALGIAQDLVAAEKISPAEAALVDLKRGALTQIVEENTPEGLHRMVPDIVDRIDLIAVEVAYSGWTESDAGDKRVRRELRKVLRDFKLGADQDLFEKTYAYVRENY